MRLYREKHISGKLNTLLTALGTALVFAAILYALWSMEGYTADQQLDSTRQAIIRAAVSCYATEGFYPPQVSYLEEHYGVQIDHQTYVIHYTLMGENTLPYVEVVVRGTS